jgi:4-amino-4-deoxy-L-arabinose transferase-like glycosyltransferase
VLRGTTDSNDWADVDGAPPAVSSKLDQLALWVFVGAVSLRLVHFATSAADPYLSHTVGDESFYWRWAKQIADGRWTLDEPYFVSPLYAYFLAMIQALFGAEIWFARTANLLLGIATVGVVTLAARRVVPGPAATVAPVLFGFCAAPLFYESAAAKSALALFFVATTHWLAFRAVERGSDGSWALAGAAAGLATLAHSILGVLLPALWLALAAARRGGVGRALAACTLGWCLAICPAPLHNIFAGGEAIPLTSNAGHNLYIGNHSGNSTGLYTSPPFAGASLADEDGAFHREAEARAGRPLTASEVSRHWGREALGQIAARPGLALKRFVRRLRWSVGAEEIADTRTYEFYTSRLPALGLPLFGFGLISALGLAGILPVARDRRLALPLAFLVLLSGALACFFVYGRLRLPLLVPLTVLATAATGRVLPLWRVGPKGRRLLAATAGLLAVTTILVHTPPLPGRQVSFLPDHHNQANWYLHRGQPVLAAEEFRLALTVRPGEHPAQPSVALKLAELYLLLGRPEEAVSALRLVSQRYPGHEGLRAKLEELER